MPLLIIEDNRDLVQVLSEGFAENGFSVDSAFSGEEGLEKISRGSYGCIILDIMLPGIDGLQVLDTVRSQGNEIPILLLCPPHGGPCHRPGKSPPDLPEGPGLRTV